MFHCRSSSAARYHCWKLLKNQGIKKISLAARRRGISSRKATTLSSCYDDLVVVTRSSDGYRSHHRRSCYPRVQLQYFSNIPRPSEEKSLTKDDSKNDRVKKDPSSTSDIWDQLSSTPNIITLTRIASTPVLAFWIIQGKYNWAIGGCCLAAFSDYLDGYLAKNHGGATILGSYLDPVADKVFINTLSLSLCYMGILPVPLVAIWAIKDTALLSATAYNIYQKHQTISFFRASIAKEPLQVTPSLLAKVNTTLQFVTVGTGIVSPITTVTPLLLESLCWITGATSVVTMMSYVAGSGMEDTSKKS